MLVRREAILAKIESTYRTDASPVAGDAVFVDNQSYGSDARMNERKGVKETTAPFQQVFGGRVATLSFDCELKGSGSAGTAPEIGVLLRGCGMLEVISAGVSVTYTPTSTNNESLTIYYYQDGKLKTMVGARGEASFDLSAGMFGKVSFTFTGHPDTPESDVALINPTYDSTVPPAFKNASFTLDSYAADVSQIQFALGNQISKPDSVKTNNGFGEIRIADRDVNGSVDPEAVLVATKDFYDMWESGANFAMDTGVVGGTAGNRWQIQKPAVSLRNVEEGDREGIRTNPLTYGANEVSGDDEFSLVFT